MAVAAQLKTRGIQFEICKVVGGHRNRVPQKQRSNYITPAKIRLHLFISTRLTSSPPLYQNFRLAPLPPTIVSAQHAVRTSEFLTSNGRQSGQAGEHGTNGFAD